jgi:hypothetical protein
VVVLAVAILAWLTQDQWRPLIPTRYFGSPHRDSSAAAVAWQPVTPGGASHTEHLMLTLGERSGPPYVMVLPADFAAFVLMDVAGRVPPAEDSTQAIIQDQELVLRTIVDLRALGGRAVLGPLANVLSDHEPVTVRGTFDVVRPSVAEFRVQGATMHGIAVPQGLIPDLVHRIEVGQHPAGLAPDGLLVNVPPFVSDIRITRGRIALYRTVP